MRRHLRNATRAVLVAALLTGCGSATDDAADAQADPDQSPAAEPFLPKAGVCHRTVESVGYRALYAEVDCAKIHQAETVYVGAFTGEDAARLAPPPPRSDPMRAAFDRCDTRVTSFVGGEWRGALISIQVVVPEPSEWTAGGRWYRCDVFALTALDGNTARKSPDDRAVEREGSLRAVLTKPSPLAFGCYTVDEYDDLTPVACTKRHRVEYVGIWTAPDGPYENSADDEDKIFDKCADVVADYVKGTPNAKLVTRGLGMTTRFPSPEAWERGDRGVRCFHWADRDRTRSLKN
ncbi:septum formation family protein [Micromonospora sp. SH-82]|uniref:septum formation family protein n=1 Tax=Micromonospora sp. SH-82 TaxID=3132938 RepID=UPI003EBBC5EC